MNHTIQKTEKWPKTWKIHLLNTSKFYFENKELEFKDGYTYSPYVACMSETYPPIFVSPLKENINKHLYELCLTIVLHINNYCYFVEFKNINNIISAEIRYFEFYKIEKIGTINHINNPYNCIQIIEEIILDDYDNRKNNDDDGDDNEPTEPIVPIDSTTLEPSFS